jgi:hypothetical protein
MGAILETRSENIKVLRIDGILKKKELDAAIYKEAQSWGPQAHVALLVIAENFEGFEKNEDWGDLSFFIKHGDQIDKIAIAADPKWKDDLMIFAAAGFRRAPVEFFTLTNVTAARAWLGE